MNQLISQTSSTLRLKKDSKNLLDSELKNEDGKHELQLSLAALSTMKGIGPVTQKMIIAGLNKYRISWQEFWEGNELLFKKIKLNEKQINSIKKFIKEQTIYAYKEKLAIREIRIITYMDEEYPPLLTELERAPLVLFGMGKVIKNPDRLSLAVVGARGMTAYGASVTEQLVMELVEQGIAINSGFMYGVDTAAHQAALRYGGHTIGILGFGFGQMYPDSQQPIFEQCLADGMTFYSPFAPDFPAKKGNFPARNQIVAGMSQGVLVTEAAAHSGSLITAGAAADLGREVFAVPGPIDSPYSEGTMHLVNQGATLINSGYEVGEYLRWPTGNLPSLRSKMRLVDETYQSFSSAMSKDQPSSDVLSFNSQFIQDCHQLKQPDNKFCFTPTTSMNLSGRLFQLSQPSPQSLLGFLNSFDFQLLSKLASRGHSFDQLCELLTCPAPQLSQALGKLEVAGLVMNLGDNWQIVK